VIVLLFLAVVYFRIIHFTFRPLCIVPMTLQAKFHAYMLTTSQPHDYSQYFIAAQERRGRVRMLDVARNPLPTITCGGFGYDVDDMCAAIMSDPPQRSGGSGDDDEEPTSNTDIVCVTPAKRLRGFDARIFLPSDDGLFTPTSNTLDGIINVHFAEDDNDVTVFVPQRYLLTRPLGMTFYKSPWIEDVPEELKRRIDECDDDDDDDDISDDDSKFATGKRQRDSADTETYSARTFDDHWQRKQVRSPNIDDIMYAQQLQAVSDSIYEIIERRWLTPTSSDSVRTPKPSREERGYAAKEPAAKKRVSAQQEDD
jgi:hypothetical protein